MRQQARLSDASLPAYLDRAGLIAPGEAVSVLPLGDGNINWVRRFRTRSGARVVKQARPELERFPEYRVTTDRIVFEARYYETVAPFDLERVCPQVLHFDPVDRVLVLADLDPAERLDAALVARIDAAYTRYLEPHGSLVHGDVQAANVLLTSGGPKLLDAEIAHVGDPAFDVGQLVAHLLLPSIARGETEPGRAAAGAAWNAYAAAFGSTSHPVFSDTALYAGIEMLRRTLGAARAAAVEVEDAALEVVAAEIRLVKNPPASPEEL